MMIIWKQKIHHVFAFDSVDVVSRSEGWRFKRGMPADDGSELRATLEGMQRI